MAVFNYRREGLVVMIKRPLNGSSQDLALGLVAFGSTPLFPTHHPVQLLTPQTMVPQIFWIPLVVC